jgi:hypothetical protein
LDRAQAIQQQVVGFLEPEFSLQLPNGQTLNGLTERGVEMIRDGYACGECLAIFRHYTVTCPVCGLSRDVMADVQEAPQLWLDHIHERNREDLPDKPEVVNPFQAMSPLKALDYVHRDPNVEQIPIEKLRKKRRGK